MTALLFGSWEPPQNVAHTPEICAWGRLGTEKLRSEYQPSGDGPQSSLHLGGGDVGLGSGLAGRCNPNQEKSRGWDMEGREQTARWYMSSCIIHIPGVGVRVGKTMNPILQLSKLRLRDVE